MNTLTVLRHRKGVFLRLRGAQGLFQDNSMFAHVCLAARLTDYARAITLTLANTEQGALVDPPAPRSDYLNEGS